MTPTPPIDKFARPILKNFATHSYSSPETTNDRMPPLIGFDDDYESELALLVGAVTRFVGVWRNFGVTLNESIRIIDLCVLPGVGVLFTLLERSYVFLYSFEDHIVSIYAGTGEKGAKNGLRLNATLNEPRGLCHSINDASILVCDTHNCLLRRITKTNTLETFAGGRIGRIDGFRHAAGFAMPTSIVSLQDGRFLVSELHDDLRLVSSDGFVTTVKLGKFLSKTIAPSGSTVSKRISGHPFVCSKKGLFEVHTSGSADLIVSAKVLGFVPTRAVEVRNAVFLVSDDSNYYYVDVSELSSGKVLIKKIVGDDKNDSFFNHDSISFSPAIAFDAATFKAYVSMQSLREAFIAELDLNKPEKEDSSTASSSGTITRPIKASSSSSKSSDYITDISFRMSTSKVTKSAPPVVQIGERFTPTIFMEVSSTGNIITTRSHGIYWFDPTDGTSRCLAGNSSKNGLRDKSRLKSRFNSIGSLCFYRIDSDNQDDENDGIETPHKAKTPNSKSQSTSTPQSSTDATILSSAPQTTYSATRPDPSDGEETFLRNLFGPDHSLLICDTSNHRIRELALDGNVLTWAGSDEGYQDGCRSDAKFSRPLWLRSGRHGDLFLTEASGIRIRHINRYGLVHTLDSYLKKQVQLVSSISELNCIQSLAVSHTEDVFYVAIGGIIFKCFGNGEFSKLLDEKVFRADRRSGGDYRSAQWSVHFDIHRDGNMSDAGFGEVVRLATPRTDGCASSNDLYVLDYSRGALRRIRDNEVRTLLPKTHLYAHVEDGVSDFARFPSPIAVCCSDNGVILMQNMNGTIVRVDHCSANSIGLLGKRFLVSNLAMTPSARSDYQLDWFGQIWHLHAPLLRIMAPGMLNKEVVERLKLAKETFTIDDFKHVLDACYCDASWDEVCIPKDTNVRSNSVRRRLQKDISRLLELYPLAALIGCRRFTKSVELQLCDRFRHASHQGMVIEENSLHPSPNAEYVHIGIDIIRQIGEIEEDGLRMEAMKLFLPYAATILRNHDLPASSQVYSSLQGHPGLLTMLIDYVHTNRVQKLGISIAIDHSDWHNTWRSLLSSSTDLESGDVALDSKSDSIAAHDIEIVGKRTKWRCHKWILCKSAFFDALFGSSFAESKASVWKATKESLGSAYLKDAALGALLDYIYTDEASRIHALSLDERESLFRALPFFFLADSNLHLGIIGSR